jgi:sigma-B regulation protein RsbU (phosphoserine phosphatase)
MKVILSKKVLISLAGILIIYSMLYDMFSYFSDISIPLLEYVSEAAMLLVVFFYYRFLNLEYNLQNKTIQETLRLFVYLLGILYFLVIVLRLILNPSFSPGEFPQLPETFGSVIYSNLVTLIAILFMTPLFLLIKNLIYYKRRKRTDFFIKSFLLSSLACAIATVITKAEPNLVFENAGIYNNSLLVVVLIFTVLISFYNTWITYLSRKEKVTYFLISVFVVWAIIYLFEFAFIAAVPAHSLAIGVFVNIVWYLMVTYGIFSSFYLLLHLPTARVFDRKMSEVASMHDLSRAISAEFDFNKLVKLLTEMTTRVIGSDSTWLELMFRNQTGLYIASSHNLTTEEIKNFPTSDRQQLSNHILNIKRPLIINELPRNHPYVYIKEWKKDIGSIIGVPLISGNGKSLGILYATKKQPFGFDPDDQAMLEAYANQGVIALDNAALLKESFERERLEEELRIARDVQQRLLPQKTPVHKHIEIEALTITAYEVGGDYYDFINLPNNHIGFIIGDVSGKGTSAAFYMAEAKGIVQSLSRSFSRPRDLLIRTNEILYESLERKTFISMLMASMDCTNRILKFARAGHCPLLHYNASERKARLLQPSGIGVGLEQGSIFEKTLIEQEVNCTKGDIFVFYTDGLSEARNAAGDEFGDERLCEIVSGNAVRSMGELKQIIIDSILKFLDGQNLADDLTLLLVKSK